MIFVLLDTFTFTTTGIFLTSFLFFMHFMKIKDFSLSLIVLFLLHPDLLIVSNFFVMYCVDRIIFQYIEYNLFMSLSLFVFFYLIINGIDISFFINVLFVIFMYLWKYNSNGDGSDFEKICEKFSP